MRSARIIENETSGLAVYSVACKHTVGRDPLSIDNYASFRIRLEIFLNIDATTNVNSQADCMIRKDFEEITSIAHVSRSLPESRHILCDEMFAFPTVQHQIIDDANNVLHFFMHISIAPFCDDVSCVCRYTDHIAYVNVCSVSGIYLHH